MHSMAHRPHHDPGDYHAKKYREDKVAYEHPINIAVESWYFTLPMRQRRPLARDNNPTASHALVLFSSLILCVAPKLA